MTPSLSGTLHFTGLDWLWPTAAALSLGIGITLWNYFRSGAPRRLRAAGASLKILAIAALLLCALEPTWSGQRSKPGANIVAVLADNSASLTIQGDGESQRRDAALQELLTGDKAGWRAKLAAAFDVKNHLFDTRLQTTTDFSELRNEERSSDLGAALATLRERFQGQPLAGVVLLTDGVATDLPDPAQSGAKLPPIYPVVIGKAAPQRDLAVLSLSATETAFEDSPINVQAEVLARGFAGTEVRGTLRMLGGAGKPAGEQTVKVTREDERLTLRFQVRPEKVGVIFYELEVAPQIQSDRPEATLANNRATVCVDRAEDPMHLLYVSGRPNWEYKFLQRAMQGDAQMQLSALIRIAKREPKFEFRGRSGESSNPLFRGFGNQSAEEIARYDQPVLLRLNTENEQELRGGFPKTAEELFRYRAVVIDDLEAEFFTPDQMSLLQRFVSERGGSLLMLGGAESFSDGGYARTAVGEMLPVYLDRKASPGAPGGPVNLTLSRDGWLQPWARLRTTEAEERKRLQALPGLDVLNNVGALKPAASVIATAGSGKAEQPVLVTQRFGRGRTAALLAGDLWKEGLGNETLRLDLEKTWRQLIRGLVADVPASIQVHAEPRPNSPEMRLQVIARDRKFQPVDNASVTLQVTQISSAQPAAAPVTIAADAAESGAGLYEAGFVARKDGAYLVEAVVTGEDGVEIGRAQTGWSTNSAASEFRSLAPNRAMLEQLAAASGGRVLEPGQVDELVKELSTRPAPVTESWSRPLWHTPAMFLFAIGCLVAEWGLRRSKGLP